MSAEGFNHAWAEIIIETLTRHQIQHICIAPGSRSAPLTLAAAENGKLICHTHFDERGLGYLALGLAKASRQPVALIVTSGTAIACVLPAVIEAHLTGERLVVLTADRPPELIDCGANQAIYQPGIFSGYARRCDLPRPAAEISARWLVAALDDALANTSSGVVHINCPFAEPLYCRDSELFLSWKNALGGWWHEDTPWVMHSVVSQPVRHQAWPYWRQKRGVVVAGRMQPEEGVAVARWAEELGWPLLADVLSQSGQPLPCADIWLANPAARQRLAQAELVVQFGSSLTGKRLLQWQQQMDPASWWLIDPLPGRRDPAHHAGNRFYGAITGWLEQHPAQSQAPWDESLPALARQAQQRAAAATADFGEAMLACRLPMLLPADGQLFLGNGLTIRLADALAQLPAGYPVFSNRGASGIDGLIATAAGIQRARQRPMLIVLGDISALFDLNALALLRQAPAPLVLLVVNNNGGGIFSTLPTPPALRERYFSMPQSASFAPAAQMFGLDYYAPDNWAALVSCLATCWQSGGHHLVELNVASEAGAETLARLVRNAAAAAP